MEDVILKAAEIVAEAIVWGAVIIGACVFVSAAGRSICGGK